MITPTTKIMDLNTVAKAHSPAALETIVQIMNDPKHKDRLKAAQTILERGYGPAISQCSPIVQIAEKYLSGELSAADAALLIEAHGRKVPLVLNAQANSRNGRRPLKAIKT